MPAQQRERKTTSCGSVYSPPPPCHSLRSDLLVSAENIRMELSQDLSANKEPVSPSPVGALGYCYLVEALLGKPKIWKQISIADWIC